ncbi:aminodeoxychorismate synthase component I [Colwellia sp. 1_MG-2023]|uniref:aminodeoxychorismate synthase component I n=1 Tax=Colwellia sp. 1_MG-2023 TaxID=3062649 RepID=UPI0026E437F4|nr:aminodeoxychorismate synthase component I [Colwellia sp. 1_MG-2023]MDO6445737.1 aminodeoxychorismate synthase component I [Colwellia sp. 1_MG-2023]
MLLNNNAVIKAKPLHFSHTLQPQALFEQFAHQPWAMWLDSCHSEHVDSRYDIIVWQPEITVTTINNNTIVDYISEQRLENSSDDPVTILQAVQQAFYQKVEIQVTELPFMTGAVGYFSYDLSRRFEQLPCQADKDINLPEMAVGIYSQAIIYDNKTQQYSLIADENQLDEIENYLHALISEKHSRSVESFKLVQQWQGNMSAEQYQEKFAKIQQYLLSGDCYQINLTQRFSAHYQGEEYQAYKVLREANQAPFSAFIRLADYSILSISPERFLRVNQNTVQSKPIKGTKPRSSNKAQDHALATALQHSEKDKAENLMIVDLLRNDISKVCLPGTVKVPTLFAVESFPAVHHLVSTVTGELESQFDALDLLREAFPGGSITGAPKIRAMEIIDELEPQRRSIYCGSIGYISACGNMDTSITIRTLVCDKSGEKNTLHCWAGGGIVADSNVDAEYQESYDKVNKILPVLAKL